MAIGTTRLCTSMLSQAARAFFELEIVYYPRPLPPSTKNIVDYDPFFSTSPRAQLRLEETPAMSDGRRAPRPLTTSVPSLFSHLSGLHGLLLLPRRYCYNDPCTPLAWLRAQSLALSRAGLAAEPLRPHGGMVVNSSAAVGWMATVASKSALVAPILRATAKPWGWVGSGGEGVRGGGGGSALGPQVDPTIS